MSATSDTISLRRSHSQPRPDAYPATGSLDRWIAILSSVFLAGLFLDGWAHNNIPDLIDTFFTPYHALLYGGFFMVAGVLTFTFVRNVASGYAWTHALPQGYLPALFGVVLFLGGGVGDMLWHETFGFEDDVEALLSPTHLLLAAGAVLYITAPLRALWSRSSGAQVTWSDFWPALLSMFVLLSLLTFFMQYSSLANPGVLLRTPFGEELTFLRSHQGIYLLLTPTMLISGAILFLLRRWQFPSGAIALLIGVNFVSMFVMDWNESITTAVTLPALLLAGLLVDWLYRWLRPSSQREIALRIFAFSLPFIIAAMTISGLLLTQILWWEIHMWAGIPFICGSAGLFLSFLTNPLPLPETT